MPFDPLRPFRLRSHLVSAFPSSSEDDSDESSPEWDRTHIIHIPGPKKDFREHLSIPENAKMSRTATDRLAFTLDKPHAAHRERPSKKSGLSVAYPPDAVDALKPIAKPTLIRRVTSKLHIAIPSRSGTQDLRSRPSTRTLPGDMGPPTQRSRSPRAVIAVSPTLPNGFLSKQHREAALRERGLLPPRKDLSEQEREADERLGCAPSPVSMTFDGSTEAERFKTSWLTLNRTSESGDSERGRFTPSYSQITRSRSSSVRSSDADKLCRSSEGKTDLPPAGRPSFCSSVPPLSTSSYLEVLHEEPSELVPITPPPPLSPANPPIIICSPLDSPSSPILVESPVSYSFSSHWPGSPLESQSQSGHPSVPEKENSRSPVSRRRTSDSWDRPRKIVGYSLSRFGTHSLTNLHRSVAGSFRAPSSSTLSTVDHSSSPTAQVPRTAIDPTMHSLGSIVRETRDIQDAESRRLSELAFLH